MLRLDQGLQRCRVPLSEGILLARFFGNVRGVPALRRDVEDFERTQPRDPCRTHVWLRDMADRVVAFGAAELNRLAFERAYHKSASPSGARPSPGAHAAASDIPQGPTKPCFAFAKSGRCTRGKTCPYSHPPDVIRRYKESSAHLTCEASEPEDPECDGDDQADMAVEPDLAPERQESLSLAARGEAKATRSPTTRPSSGHGLFAYGCPRGIG